MRAPKTNRRVGFIAALGASAAMMLASASPAAAEAIWRIDSLANSFAKPGAQHRFIEQLSNIGDSTADGTGGDPIKFTAALPTGMTVKDITVPIFGGADWSLLGWECSGDGPGAPPSVEGAQNVTCLIADSLEGHSNFGSLGPLKPVVAVDVDPEANGALTSHFTLSGAGLAPVSTAEVTRVTEEEPAFGIDSFDVETKDANGNAYPQAGGHPYAITNTIDFNTDPNPRISTGEGFFAAGPSAQEAHPVESQQDVVVDLPQGLVGNPTVATECTGLELTTEGPNTTEGINCPTSAQIGTVLLPISNGLFSNLIGPLPLYNMEPPPGAPARFAFNVLGTVVAMNARLRYESDYGLTVVVPKISQGLDFSGSQVTFWGTPADGGHDPERTCREHLFPEYVGFFQGPSCPSGERETPFLRMPTTCTAEGEGLHWQMAMDAWSDPGAVLPSGAPDLSDPAWDEASIDSHNPPGYPLAPSEWGSEKGVEKCGSIPVKANMTVQPTLLDTESPTGLLVHVDVPNPGLGNSSGIASSDIKKVKVSLPEGVTLNPSQGEGLGVCTPARYESTELSFHPDGTKGCPSNSKVGTVTVKTPLLHETLEGGVYIAEPDDPTTTTPGAENPFDSLLAIYMVVENPDRGVLIKLAGKVEPDPVTGQLVTTVDDLPQLPFSSFDLKFREGARSPLATPRLCGEYTTTAEFTPWSDTSKTITSSSSFEIVHGIGGGPCPSGGTAPFEPGLQAGSTNNNALSYSPFTVRMTRNDGEQEITRFSADLPPGLAAKLAGVPKCSDAALAATAVNTGIAERDNPTCPAASQVGRVLTGFGVGSSLTYATGKVYLAGPYNGAPVSVATVASALVGPFDLGTVVQRSAFTVDPETAVVHVDSKASDPIPHILKGVELHLRDVRVYMDRPEFTINPTSCDPMSVGAFLNGSGADFTTPADDPLVDVSNPFQAANCSLLPFKPKLSFRLRGGTRRAAHPALTATLRARPGDANLHRAVVALPRSEFLDQAHIGTVCTRVQFAANECPKASIYGHATATTPLLDQPLSGNVYLRSSDNLLPDLVVALRGEIDVNAVGRVDSINQGIRTTFETIPDTPLTKFVLKMQGGRKGLFFNSRDICARPGRAEVRFTGQNGKVAQSRPRLRASCGKARKHKRHSR